MNKTELKKQYNYYLKRYLDGCNYIYEHPNEAEKYEGAIVKFIDKLNYLLGEIKEFTNEEAINGFKI